MTRFEDVIDKVDIVLDTIGGETQERSWGVLKPGSILVSTVQQPSENAAMLHGVRQAMVLSAPPINKILTHMAKLVDRRQIQPHVSSVLPLQQVRKAHEMIEASTREARLFFKWRLDPLQVFNVNQPHGGGEPQEQIKHL